MAYYDGTLSHNRVLFSAVTGALYNMIIRQTVRSDPESEGQLSLLDDFKRDAGLYGDRILEYFCSSLVVKIHIIILTQPSAWLMYVLSFYFLGYVFIVYKLWSHISAMKIND